MSVGADLEVQTHIRCTQCRQRAGRPCLTSTGRPKHPHACRRDRYWQWLNRKNGRQIDRDRRRWQRTVESAILIGRSQEPMMRSWTHRTLLYVTAQTPFGTVLMARGEHPTPSVIKRKQQMEGFIKAFLAALPGAAMSTEPVRSYEAGDEVLDGDLPEPLHRKP
jgi:hypothetical protein